ncbi:MAG: hypothetical protein ACFFBS_00915 [Promethearchaeota archaeon]
MPRIDGYTGGGARVGSLFNVPQTLGGLAKQNIPARSALSDWVSRPCR